MSRDVGFYLEIILEAINKIQSYTAGLSFEAFSRETMIQDAVAANLYMIGEAIRRIPESLWEKYKEVGREKLVEVQDHLLREYYDLNPEFLWGVIRDRLPLLKRAVEELLHMKA
ncbi:HepT-like ribonuclease domain-containing protein [Desulfovirgula thermocuniculi]|uniref:HepT-like ribonuclease domain-containing protein n=1 Tax=Desulfovirgula thermocuniculi TaxID=348842 RepID=UPI0003FFFF71|nr:HepT-like ribonuclease domain-containing protein [Desulfovirgula thermocuniculi]